MLKINFGAFCRIVLQQHLTIGFSTFVHKAAHFIVVVKHHVDAVGGVVVPCGKYQEV